MLTADERLERALGAYERLHNAFREIYEENHLYRPILVMYASTDSLDARRFVDDWVKEAFPDLWGEILEYRASSQYGTDPDPNTDIVEDS